MKHQWVISFLSACAGGGLAFLFSGQDIVFTIIASISPFIIPLVTKSLRDSFDMSAFDTLLRRKQVKIGVSILAVLGLVWAGQAVVPLIGSWGVKLSVIVSSFAMGILLSKSEKEASHE